MAVKTCLVSYILFTFFTLKTVCRATVAVFPASYLFVSTGFLGLVFIIITYVHSNIGKEGRLQEEEIKNSQ